MIYIVMGVSGAGKSIFGQKLAQRDYFGAHQYERTDQPRGTFFHTNWQEKNN